MSDIGKPIKKITIVVKPDEKPIRVDVPQIPIKKPVEKPVEVVSQ